MKLWARKDLHRAAVHESCALSRIEILLGRSMKTVATLFVLSLFLFASHAVAQLGHVNKIGKAEARKIASGLVIGMRDEAATHFLAQNGLRPGARFSYTNRWTEVYGLTNGLLILEIRPQRSGVGRAGTNGVLKAASVVSSAVHSSPDDVQIARTNAP